VLVVDDNSPDGTADAVRAMMGDGGDRIHLLEREKKMGLGTAYVAGFKYAIAHGYDYVFEMDADFSHDPGTLPRFLEAIQEYDLVLGSRYIQGVNVVNWPMKRLLLSYFANQYTRIVTGLPVRDATGGFKCFRVEVLKSIDLDQVRSNGYSFQIEMSFKAWKKGYRIREIPIVFMDRRVGISKMSKKIVREAVTMVWRLRFQSMFGRIS
jgi:dolichol-phosphate mannosyltransferase